MWPPPGATLRCPWCRSFSLAAVPQGLRCGACQRVCAVRRGVWNALGPHRPERTLAQIANSIPPEPQLYEALWRRSAPSRFSAGTIDLTDELHELSDAVRPHPRQVVVDLGCSEGLYGRTLARQGSVVLAVDHSRAFLHRAQRRAAAEGVALWPIRAVAQHLPLGDSSVHAVVIGGSLNEIGDQQAALAESRRVLVAGGTAFSTSLVRAASSIGRRFQRTLVHTGIGFPTLDETTALFEAAGLRVVDVRCDGILARVRAVAVLDPAHTAQAGPR